MATLKAFGGNNILNMTMTKVYQQNPAKFSGSGTASGFTYSFAVSSPPLIELGNAGISPPHNIIMKIRNVTMDISAQNGNGPNLKRGVDMRAMGIVGITNGVLSITSIVVQIENPTGIDNLIVNVINSQIVPKLQRSLIGIALPQLTKIFNTSLSVEVRSGTVIQGPALEIGGRISGVSGGDNADQPTSANITSLNNGSASNALVIGTVEDDAVNTLIRASISNLSQPFNETKSGPAGTAAGIKGTIRATTPVLSIRNGRGSAATTVSITGFKAGIKDPVFGWHWVSIPVPNVSVVINNTLSTQNGKGIITLTGVGSISIGLNWPTVLRPVESLVQTLLNGVVRLFKSDIDNAVAGKKFELFKLPSTIPGTSHSATLSFEGNSTGLSYFGSSVRAILRVRA